MSIQSYKPEEIKEMSMLEIAYEIMKDKKQAIPYMDLLNQVAELKEMSQEELARRIAYLYTDLNIDGRFVCLADGSWGLRTWYPLEQIEEEIIQTQKTSAKRRKEDLYDDEEIDEDLEEDYEDFEDEFEDLEDELDELSNDENDEDDTEEAFAEEDDLEDFDDDELADEDNDEIL